MDHEQNLLKVCAELSNQLTCNMLNIELILKFQQSIDQKIDLLFMKQSKLETQFNKAYASLNINSNTNSDPHLQIYDDLLRPKKKRWNLIQISNLNTMPL